MQSSKNIYKRNGFSVALGLTLFLQAFTSLLSGILFLGPFIDKSDPLKIFTEINSNPSIAHLSILLDIITALGIVFLGVLFFNLLKRINPLCAVTALAFYIVEAMMLIVSKFFGFGLIQVSNAYLLNNDKSLIALGQILLQIKDFAYSMHILPFGIGAIIFYYMLLKANALPTWLSLWGLLTVIPILIGSMINLFGIDVPFIFMLPYVPFEFFAGIFILFKGLSIKNKSTIGLPL